MIRILQIYPLALAVALAVPAYAQPGAGYDITSHDLQLEPDFASQQLSGDQNIALRATAKLSELAFTGNAMIIDKAMIGGRRAKVEYRRTETVFVLPKPMQSGEKAVLRLRYHGKPKQGVNFDGNSVFTSYFACDWMFCAQDAPGDKAMIAMELVLPAGMESLGIGSFIGFGNDALEGKEIHRWWSKQPYSAYLYDFAAGPFMRTSSKQDGIEITSLAAADLADRLPAMQAAVEPMIRFLSDKAGLPPPAGRYTQLLVKGTEAQEAATYSVLGTEYVDADLADPANGWVQVHELAHMWWGNLVTCESWQDFWLNEGITTFMTAAWKEHRFGRQAYDAELDGARRRLAKVTEAGWDRPLAFAGKYPSLGTRRAIQYSKGALFMDALRTQLGDTAFWAGLKAYTVAHQGGTVTSRDFQQAMEQASGRDLSALFTTWVYGDDSTS